MRLTAEHVAVVSPLCDHQHVLGNYYYFSAKDCYGFTLYVDMDKKDTNHGHESRIRSPPTAL